MSRHNWLKPKVPNFTDYFETRSPRGNVLDFNVQPQSLICMYRCIGLLQRFQFAIVGAEGSTARQRKGLLSGTLSYLGVLARRFLYDSRESIN